MIKECIIDRHLQISKHGSEINGVVKKPIYIVETSNLVVTS